MKLTKSNLFLLREANELITLKSVDDEEFQRYRNGAPISDDVIPVYSDEDPSGIPTDYKRAICKNELTEKETDEFLKLQFLARMRSIEKGVNILSGIAIAGVILAIFAFIYFLIQFAQLSSLFH